jgi:actin-related protein
VVDAGHSFTHVSPVFDGEVRLCRYRLGLGLG